ncbi:protein DMP3 [Fagus crenata]
MSTNLRPRVPTTTSISPDPDDTPKPQLQRQQSFSQRAISQTLTTTANLANLLPTGTLMAFQLLIPVFTQNGMCDSATRPMTLTLLLLLSLSCFLACFTDTIKTQDGQVYHGLATFNGLWLFDCPDKDQGLPDLSKYKIRLIDVIHAVLTVLVFGAVALRDKNVVGCFYPSPGQEAKEVLDIVPVGVGIICSLLFVVFPTRRHGIGYPVTPGK